ncbi:MAG: toxin of addiction system [Idiomarina sp.]|uniref:toxin of addiction system n=1 Tax=Idiomarina sp. TaxID=1874361 RepID=UPI000C6506B8|nr:toxin of addiction system [Idiomarina sp.]MBT43612.1 toxin of addiction system [Idiomarina sp.]
MKNLSALVGAIVFAWLPESERPHAPGPKYRPVLVIDTDIKNRRIRLAYGTSQKTEVNYAGEITMAKDDVPGLSKDTKFALKKSFWVPLDNAYFVIRRLEA